MHLTNYSINKKNEKFIKNENCEQDDFGYKWSLGAFCRHLEQVGIDMNLLWSRCYDVIIKTILCGENYVQNAMKKNGMYRQNCFEVFGFDILVDSDLKPWLLEVNLSPSLAAESPLDMVIKTTLLTDTFNMVAIKRFDRRKESLNKLKYRTKTGGQFSTTGTGLGKSKQYSTNTAFAGSIPLPTTGATELYIPNFTINPQVETLIDKITSQYESDYNEITEAMKSSCYLKFRDIVAETVHEFNRKGNFVRIYPARNSKLYDKFFTSCKALNKLIYKSLYSNEILPYATRANVEQSANPVAQKNNLMKTNSMQVNNQKSREGLHSAGGQRIRSSQSNNKLIPDESPSTLPQNNRRSSSNQHTLSGSKKNSTLNPGQFPHSTTNANSSALGDKQMQFRDTT